jgi:hypothetical protein
VERRKDFGLERVDTGKRGSAATFLFEVLVSQVTIQVSSLKKKKKTFHLKLYYKIIS